MKASALLFAACTLLLAFGCKGRSDDSATSTPSGSTGSNATPNAASSGAATGYAAVQAVFDKSCVSCHGAQRPKAGVDLTNYASVIKGGKDGPIVVAGSPDTSDLIAYIKGTKQPRMPKGSAPLSDSDTKTISNWIQAGAKND